MKLILIILTFIVSSFTFIVGFFTGKLLYKIVHQKDVPKRISPRCNVCGAPLIQKSLNDEVEYTCDCSKNWKEKNRDKFHR